ncbi:phage tail tape measure C-terminal domain-containing protein [Roseivivax halotolerans]|uniref:phage tail tape measure C-terminal domain-containing protein n=1 Tax=Roseivivax halotolerans TaxID=93684 RepID=UPI001587D62A|nr:phage tail tape measure C-terminal domain-containing protein [Roseivivax halotolerans]
MSAQMAAQARDRAAQTLGAASAAADQYTASMQRGAAATQQGVMVGHQLSDVLITSQMGFQSVGMIALQQGSQLAAQMNSLKASGGSVFSTLLAGFTSLVNPLSLITIGAVAAGAAIAKWFFAAGEEAKSFGEALGEVNGAISELSAASDTLSGATLGNMADGYGRVNEELRRHLDLMRRIAEIEAINSTRDLIASVQDAVTSDGNLFTTELDAMRRAFDTTNDRARSLLAMLDQIKQARTFEEQLAALTRMRSEVESTTGGLDGATGAAQAMLVQLIKSEDAALRLRAAQDGTTDSTYAGAGAANSLAFEIGTAADAAAVLLANLNSVPSAISAIQGSVSDQIASIQATNRSLEIQLSEGMTSAAANRRVQLEQVISEAKNGGPINFDQVADAWNEINALEEAAKRTQTLRDQLAESRRPARPSRSSGGGGGSSARNAALSEEQSAVEKLNESLKSRLDSLTAERIEMGLLASGQMETAQGAQAMAEAMMAGGGAVDTQTSAMIRQIDTAAKLNEELRKVATDPVKEWMDSVPNWIEAGQQIEMGAINHLKGALADFMKTGKLDMESLGDAILGTVADIVADKAVAELMTLAGRNDPGATGLGGVLGGLFASQGDAMTGPSGGADVAQGGIQAGQSISQAMVQAGGQVSQQISSAMMQGGQRVQMAHAQGGQQAANAARMAGVQHGQQVRMATTTSGGQHATQVRSAITTAGQQHAQAVGMAASGGSGFLSGMGGWQGLLGMAFGAFDVGGISTEPANFANAPVAAFRNAPHFAQGTPNTSGIPAILHENEAVIPLTKGRKVPVEMSDAGHSSGVVQNFNWTVHSPDADSFRRSKDQISADMARAGQRAIQKNG